tara:strand:- start:110 stop:787 length:678 start_codon:yes stop_codon:yes gene_type:complete
MDILHHITSINSAIEKNKPLHQALENTQFKILEEIESRGTNKLRIQKELELRKMPSQAIGTAPLYNKLNENYSHYDKDQFNNILRFFTHIEEKEKHYRQLYLKTTSSYMADPKSTPLSKLNHTKKELDYSYKLLMVLANEINGDVVSYGKVYNKIEDAGLFMSTPEKRTQDYLNDISKKMGTIIKGLNAVFHQLEETNTFLSSISESTFDASSSLYDISYDTSRL